MKLAQTILSKLRRSGIFRRSADVAPTELENLLITSATNISLLRSWETASGSSAIAPASWNAPVLWRFSRAGRKAAEGCRTPKPRGISGAAFGFSRRDTAVRPNPGEFRINILFTSPCTFAQGVQHAAQGIQPPAQAVQSLAQSIRWPAQGVRTPAQGARQPAQGGNMAARIMDRSAWASPSEALGVLREFSRRECGLGVETR